MFWAIIGPPGWIWGEKCQTQNPLGSVGPVVWWDIGANFLNYLSICTASSDDPLRAHRNRVKLILERNFVNSYFIINLTLKKFQNMGGCFKIQSPRKCFNLFIHFFLPWLWFFFKFEVKLDPNRINFGHVCHGTGGEWVYNIVLDTVYGNK